MHLLVHKNLPLDPIVDQLNQSARAKDSVEIRGGVRYM